jgi:hypothetical protein
MTLLLFCAVIVVHIYCCNDLPAVKTNVKLLSNPQAVGYSTSYRTVTNMHSAAAP